jgi:3-oxoacyl-[acyl-carrier protein] reductase
MTMLLKDKVAVITGSNRGIGRAILQLFARQGADVWACARQSSPEFDALLNDVRAETGRTITSVYGDLADSRQVKAIAQTFATAKSPVDVLVNNAGAITTAPFMMTTEAAMRSMMDINYLPHILFSQFLARAMVRRRNGSIINISSSAAVEGNEGRLAYGAAKGALITATKVMARELGPANIRVNAIAPGLTETAMMRSSTKTDALTETLARTALRRLGQPEEIAGVALFLASDLSSYMTGQVLSVDGGM